MDCLAPADVYRLDRPEWAIVHLILNSHAISFYPFTVSQAGSACKPGKRLSIPFFNRFIVTLKKFDGTLKMATTHQTVTFLERYASESIKKWDTLLRRGMQNLHRPEIWQSEHALFSNFPKVFQDILSISF
jgi:hypothetical protein